MSRRVCIVCLEKKQPKQQLDSHVSSSTKDIKEYSVIKNTVKDATFEISHALDICSLGITNEATHPFHLFIGQRLCSDTYKTYEWQPDMGDSTKVIFSHLVVIWNR